MLLVKKWASHFEIFDKNDIQNFAFHFLCNKKRFKIIKCHVQGTLRHCTHVNDLQYAATQN
jgi:hypothetical protein